MERNLKGYSASAAALSRDVPPVYGIAWDRAVLAKLDTKRLIRAFSALRNSKFAPAEYDPLTQFVLESYGSAGALPTEFSEW